MLTSYKNYIKKYKKYKYKLEKFQKRNSTTDKEKRKRGKGRNNQFWKCFVFKMKLCTAKGILLLVSFCIPLVSISNLPFLLILWKSMSDGFKSEAKKGRGILFSRLTEENLWWKMTFVRKQPLMEDDIWWKTTFHGRPNFYLDKKICKNLHLSWVRIGGWQTDVLDVLGGGVQANV